MKKLITIVMLLIFVLSLAGCNNKDMNYIIENEDGEYSVSLNVENKDSSTHFNIGDEVVVYYDGNIAESYPMQINKVYAITLRTPADRTENDKS